MRPLLLALAALAVAAPAASAAPGDLDTVRVVRFSDASEEPPAGLVAQSTGRIVLVGDSNAGRTSAVPPRNRLQFVRLHADGSPDTSFFSAGRRLIGLSAGGSLTAVSVVPDGDAFYVLARHDLQKDLPNCTKRALFDCFDFSHRIAVLRFTASGALDTGFGGGDGLVLLAAGAEHRGGANGTDSVSDTHVPLAMTVLPGGRVVVADEDVTSGASRLTRLNPAGAGIDTGFGHPVLRGTPRAVSPGPLGSVTVAGDGGVERFSSTGVPDRTFAASAQSTGALLGLSDGSVVAAGVQRTDSFFREPLLATRLGRFGAPVWSALANFPRLTADGNATARVTSAALGLGGVALGGSVDLDPDRPGDVGRHGRLALALLRLDGTAPTHSLITTDIAASEDESIAGLATARDGELVAVASVDLDLRPGFVRTAAAVVRYRAN